MARRARGAGAVLQRADGRWEAQLRIGPSRRRSLYAQTRPDVVVKLDQARWSMALGLPVRMPVTRTLAEFLNDWLEVTKGRVRCSTFENYVYNVRRINSQLGAIPLCRLPRRPSRRRMAAFTLTVLATRGSTSFTERCIVRSARRSNGG